MKHLKQDVLTQESINERNIALLRENFPGAIEENIDGSFTVNANKLQMLIDPKNATIEENGYELNWVGKKEAYHTAFSKNTKILKPLKEDSVDFDTTENILIKGDNLDALKILRSNYFEAIKLIFIDPPYNTTSEGFIYRDNFTKSLEETMEELGYDAENIDYIKNIQGARTHSGWLGFMYPRLLLARDLLKDDGFIFISIDDNEQANLKILCNEIFGEKQFVGNVAWKKTSGDNKPSFAFTHDNILIYGKKSNNLPRVPLTPQQRKQYKNPDNDDRGDWAESDYRSKWSKEERQNLYYGIQNPNTKEIIYPDTYSNSPRVWACSEETHQKNVKDALLWWGENGTNTEPKKKRFLEEHQGANTRSVWLDAGMNDEASTELRELLGNDYFNNPKPVKLIQRLVNNYSNNGDVILDFFAGSGTTGHSVIKQNYENRENRKFILVQIAEQIHPKKQKDAYDFVKDVLKKEEATIFEITAERLRRSGTKIKNNHQAEDKIENFDIGFRVFEVVEDEKQAIYKKSLEEVSQADLTLLTMPQMEDIDTVLYNLLVAEALPLSTKINCLKENAFYIADNVAFIVGDIKLEEVSKLLAEHKKVEYITIYSPLVNDNKFSLEVGNELTRLGFSNDKLRFRG